MIFSVIGRRCIGTSVKIVEVGPRDGLQNEPKILTTVTKYDLIRGLAKCGLRTIEATSFVSPKWVPQMADHADLYHRLCLDEDLKKISLPVLIPNAHGLKDALKVGVREVSVFTTPSELFSRRNTNMSVAESLHAAEEIVALARKAGVSRIRGYVSCVVGCPYEGIDNMDPGKVLSVCNALLSMGCYEVSLGDTIGVGTVGSFDRLLSLLTRNIDPARLALHCHDTYGQALANIYLGVSKYGIETVDAAVAGLGGCPFAAGASGNVATEDVVYMLHGMGIQTGINLPELAKIGASISEHLGRRNESRAGRAILANKT